MIYNAGDFPEDATVYIPFNTFTSDDPSASSTITNLADGDIKVHKDGGTTEIATDGATVAINFDSVTGNHLITIDTSAHADYATGSDYLVRIEGTTVDGATINAWVGHFSIENRTTFPKADYPSNFSDMSITATTGRVDVGSVGGTSQTAGDVPGLIATAQADLDIITGSDGAKIAASQPNAVSFTSGVTISNASGSALTLTSTGGNGRGLFASGNGSGAGIRAVGGATGTGILGAGGSTSGVGIKGVTQAGNSEGIQGLGTGSAAGISGIGGATGHGILGTGGTNGDGIKGAGTGTGVDIRGNITGNLSGSVGSVTGEVSADVTKISGSATAADNLEASALGIISGTAATGTLSTTVMTSDLSGYADDELIGRVVVWTGGTAAGQASAITDYASASGTVTYDAITTAPDNGDTFVIV